MSNSDAVAWDVNSDAIIWDVEAKQLLHRLRGHRDDVNAVDLTPDGARAVTASVDKMVRLWRVDDGSLVKEMAGHADIVRSLAVSPKDGSIVSGDKTGEIRLWDGKTGDFLRVFASQDNDIGSLRFSPDGSLLLSTSGRSSKPQRIYDAATGKELTSYTKHGNVVIAGAFSPMAVSWRPPAAHSMKSMSGAPPPARRKQCSRAQASRSGPWASPKMDVASLGELHRIIAATITAAPSKWPCACRRWPGVASARTGQERAGLGPGQRKLWRLVLAASQGGRLWR